MNEPTIVNEHQDVPAWVMERIVEVASGAPSVHNTQPWRWRGGGHTLELYADRTRQLTETDPLGRNLTISCGAALHHAQVAAEALGWGPAVIRHPHPDHPDLLARMELAPAPPPPAAADALAAAEGRSTDRRRFTSWPVSEERLAHLARIANHWGARAVPLTDASERFIAERLIVRGAERQQVDAAATDEQRAWQDRSEVDGVPGRVLPRPAGRRGAHKHRFADTVSGDDPGPPEVGATDGLIVFFDSLDDPRAWLLAGEGLSAMWLSATAGGLSVVPLTQVVEVPETRQALKTEVLGGLAHPLVLARVGWQAIGQETLARTPRRAVSDILEMT